jgi:hypothetical protein
MNSKRGGPPPNVEEHVDTWAMIRRVAWAMAAVLTVVAAMLAARARLVVQRLGEATTVVAKPAPARTPASQPLAQIDDPDAETKRLAQAIRLLSADRDRLATRVATLERTIDDLTGSIARLPASNVLATPIPPVPVVPVPRPVPLAARRLDHGQFGVDLGGASSVDGLRALWASLQAKHAPLLNGLWPVMSVRDRPRPATFDLRLVVGPLPNAENAARLCAALAALGVNCQPAIFNGERMALRQSALNR